MLDNSLMVINPYYDRGSWVFDDEATGLIEIEGWLCPALLKYFKSAPQRLFAKVENLTN